MTFQKLQLLTLDQKKNLYHESLEAFAIYDLTGQRESIFGRDPTARCFSVRSIVVTGPPDVYTYPGRLLVPVLPLSPLAVIRLETAMLSVPFLYRVFMPSQCEWLVNFEGISDWTETFSVDVLSYLAWVVTCGSKR